MSHKHVYVGSIPTSATMIYLIGDLHLDHTNIIQYCNRPFKSVDEMNDTLVKRWNETVGTEDIVYYLGDISYGRGSRDGSWWWQKLNGKKTLIKGNHDRKYSIKGITPVYRWHIVELGGIKFLLVHSPTYDKPEWDGWIIHGHHHNNYPESYPLVNKENKTINVSVEVLDYYPLPLDKLLTLL